jgi:(S)-2-hydroxyglutarate dehydrogenase
VNHIAVIGGGIIGLAAAWKVSKAFPNSRISLFEKESAVGRHQSGNNSGVLHCGLYYKPGSLKAQLAVQGIREMVSFCETYSIPFEMCGKLVLATCDLEASRLQELEQRGNLNGLSGIKRLNRDEISEREPYARGIEGLEVPEEGIVDYGKVCNKLSQLLIDNGHFVYLGAEIRSGILNQSRFRLDSSIGGFEFDYVINCAGLHSDKVCKKLQGNPSVKIIPFRGEYFRLKAESQKLVRHLIYPVPDPDLPFLGVHFTRLIHGGVEAGPNAVLALSREGYQKTDINLGDLTDYISFPGFWRFIKRYPKLCCDEILQSLSRHRFCKSLQKLVPEIRESDLESGGAGVRAQAMNRNGMLVSDFTFVQGEKVLHVLNSPSPGATASLAIGGAIAKQISSN